MKLLALVLFCIGYFSPPIYAQFVNLELEAYDSEEGLSQNHVYSIIQDKKGFIWIGTDDGLNRFDGHDFKVFKRDERNSHSILDNSIRSLYADDSSIWVGTNDGLCRYFTETESFYYFPIDANDPSKLHGSQVAVIKKHSNGSMWLGYLGNGLDVMVPGRKEIQHYSTQKELGYRLKSNLVTSILFMPDDYTIVGTLSGIEVINNEGIVLNEKQANNKYPWLSSIHQSVKCLTLSSDKRTLWIGTELNGLYKIDLQTGVMHNYNDKNTRPDFDYVLTVHEDFRGNIWIGAEVIYVFDKEQDKPVPYYEYGIQGTMEIVNPIYCIFEDRDKNIWLGTSRIGALKCNPGSRGIQHYYSNQAQEGIRNEVFCYTQDDEGVIWVGTGETGLYSLKKDFRGFQKAPLSDLFKTRSIKCMYRDSEGYHWIGSWNGGLTKYHPGKKTLENYHPDNGTFGSLHVWDITGDDQGNLWFGTLRDGLGFFSPKTKRYYYYRNKPGDSTSLINDDVLCLLIDAQKRLWVGTGYGLSVLKPGAESFINFRYSGENSLSSNLIFSLHEDSLGRVWVGTNGGGITIFNKDLGIEKILGERDGLPSNTVTAMVADNHQNVWVSTYSGLAKIRYTDLSVQEVPQIAGLKSKEFIPRSGFKSSDGKLFFGRFNGFILFHPDSLRLDALHEKVVFTSLKIQNHEIVPGKGYDNREILKRSIAETDGVELSYKDNSVTITFAPLTYNWQGSLHYAYLMENLDDEWQYTSADRRFVHYTNLTPGEYVLHVKASFDGKNWPDDSQSLKVFIAPPWWATSWFRGGIIILSLLILYMLYRVRVRFLKSQKKRLEYLVEQGTSEIQTLLKEVAEKNNELQSINEELKLQRDTLEERGRELEQTQTTLQGINENLEELVSKRTKKLNLTLRELETFLYRASHDLRGPISSMLGLIKLASLEHSTDPISKTYTDFLQKTTIKLERTLQKLTQKYTIQKLRVANEPIDKQALIKILDDATQQLSVFRQQDFELNVTDDLTFETDRTLLNILMINLLENAFYFSQRAPNRKVSLEIKQPGNTTVISVLDHGPGIKHEVKDKIFSMFYRGNELSTGNGLGLYLVKSALKKVKGKIIVETEVGSYSKFVVTLPGGSLNGFEH